MFVIDRFEGQWAVIEYGRETFNLPRKMLPSDAREGDLLNINISVDRTETRKREQEITKLADELFE